MEPSTPNRTSENTAELKAITAKTMWKTRTASTHVESKETPLAQTSKTSSRNLSQGDQIITKQSTKFLGPKFPIFADHAV